jgi:predicted Zn-dependent protease
MDGIYVAGDMSWSIYIERYNSQFTGQRFYKITGRGSAAGCQEAATSARVGARAHTVSPSASSPPSDPSSSPAARIG